jgi:type II secretory pathway component GspD/PulD (secretin)
MSRYRYFKMVLWLFMTGALVLSVYPEYAQAIPKDATVDVGRTNPFAKIEMGKKPVTQVAFSAPRESGGMPELLLESVTLKFLNAKNVKPVVEKMISEYGSVSIDEKTNSIIVCETRERLDEILSEINKVDKTPSQIMVEVVILDVQLDDDTEIGINWDILSTKNYDISYRQNFTTARIGSTIEDATTIGNATAFNSTGFGGDFAVISGTVRNVVHLIQEKKNAEILASPRVMMVSGQSASIEAVEELPYTELTGTAQGGAEALTSTQFKLVGVKLGVEATLVDCNNIFLTVQAEQNVAVGQSSTQVPIIDTRKARSSLMLREGQVVVFGGLRRQDKTKTIKQIPILGDIPLLGLLFKSTEMVVKNSELIVFLSPHVYSGGGGPVEPKAMAKFDRITKGPILEYPNNKAECFIKPSDK